MKIEKSTIRSICNRLLQILARNLPGGRGFRVLLHRLRGVTIGKNVFIGTDVIIETALPHLVYIGDHVALGTRCLLLAHFDGDVVNRTFSEDTTLKIHSNVFIGPGAIILPRVTIGEGAVVAAGSVVTKNVPPRCMVQGNPAEVVAKCDTPLSASTSTWDFVRGLRRVRDDNKNSHED